MVIGAHSVVGAQAVVVNDAPAYSVITGIPAVARRRAHAAEPTAEAFYTDPAIYI